MVRLRAKDCSMLLLWVGAMYTLPLLTTAASINSQEPSTRNNRRHGKSGSSRRDSADTADSVYTNLPLKPSLVMIPLDLQETVNSDLDPDVNNLDQFHLLDIMGEDYDSHFMSLRRPSEMTSNPNGTLLYQFTKEDTPRGKMPDEIEALTQKAIQLSADGYELRVKFNRKTKKKIQKFLWSYSYCPVRYKWKELSIRFWPRWIKEGRCDNKRSCSIPAGMSCQPTKMKNIKLLRYYCPYKGNCEWIKISYPILSQCTCACPPQSDSDY